MDLETFYSDAGYNKQSTWTRHLGITTQPGSFTDFDIHPEFAEVFRLWTQDDSFRGLDLSRLWSIVLNVKHVLGRCEGSLAELGVYKGQCSAVLSYYASKHGRRMYLSDTFTGFAPSQYEKEIEMSDGKISAFKDTSLEYAKSIVGDYEGNRWMVGMFPDTISEEMEGDKFSFVSIDCDIYEPIYEGLRFFWPRMVPGGMIFVHDYSSGYWPGASQAVDEFCAEHKVAGTLLPDLAGTFVFAKPG